MPITMIQIKDAFLLAVEAGDSFEGSISKVAGLLNQMPNADNFQFAFDTLYWHWIQDSSRGKPSVEELDRIALKYSRFREHQEAVIQTQIESADEWGRDLEAAGMTPFEALGFAQLAIEDLVDKQSARTAIAGHPSPIAIPQQIVRMYRAFYRAEGRHPERTNVLKPLLLAKEVITSSTSTGEDLTQEIHGRIFARMMQVRNSTAKGRWVIFDKEEESRVIRGFAEFIVFNVLQERFGNDKSIFSSRKGIGLIEDACLAIYHLQQDAENSKTI